MLQVETQGPVAAGAVAWTLSGQPRVTVIAKVTLGYDAGGRVSVVEPAPLVRQDNLARPCDLAPFLPGAQVVCVASPANTRLRVSRAGATLLELRGPLGPVGASLARFGVAVVSLDARVEDHGLWSAPPEQRVTALAGDETIALEGVVELTLPRLALRIAATLASADVPFDARLDTIVLEPGKRRLCLVWRGSFPTRADMLSGLELSAELTVPKTTAQMAAVAPPALPFDGQVAAAPPIAVDLHAGDGTGTVSRGQRLPRPAPTPFIDSATERLSREELKRAAAAAAVPFAEGVPTKRPAPAVPVPGAPWTDNEKDREIRPPAPGEGTIDMPFLRRPPPPAQPVESPPPEEPPAPPVEPWVQGPRVSPEPAPERPRRAPRKDLLAAVYGKRDPGTKK